VHFGVVHALDVGDVTGALSAVRAGLRTRRGVPPRWCRARRPPSRTVAAVPSRDPIAVVLLHRHEVVRDALRQRVDATPDLVVVASAPSAPDAVAAFARCPDALVLMEEQTPSTLGMELMAELRAISGHVRAVMLVESDDLGVVVAAIRAGVAGIVRSRTPASVLVDTVRTVAGGACVLDHDALALLAAAWDDGPRNPLSTRERDVLACLADGLTNSQAAARLYVSRETVKTHVSHLLRKLEVEDRSSAVDKAARLGLLVAQ
jgi:DNA-binding NarL/FixJ family response regulator